MSFRFALLAFVVLAGCGTYSTLRPAPVLAPGRVELGAGIAANQIGEVLPVVQGHVGLFPRVEIGGHYEVYSGFGELRVQALEEEHQGVSMSFGLGGGFATTILDEVGQELSESQGPDFALFGSFALSRRFGTVVEPYVAGRVSYLVPADGWVFAPVGGVRLNATRWLSFSLEGGAAIHVRAGVGLGIAQGALGIGLHF
jgi:hypothetical protein